MGSGGRVRESDLQTRTRGGEMNRINCEICRNGRKESDIETKSGVRVCRFCENKRPEEVRERIESADNDQASLDSW